MENENSSLSEERWTMVTEKKWKKKTFFISEISLEKKTNYPLTVIIRMNESRKFIRKKMYFTPLSEFSFIFASQQQKQQQNKKT